jgi:hypothetical protein
MKYSQAFYFCECSVKCERENVKSMGIVADLPVPWDGCWPFSFPVARCDKILKSEAGVI